MQRLGGCGRISRFTARQCADTMPAGERHRVPVLVAGRGEPTGLNHRVGRPFYVRVYFADASTVAISQQAVKTSCLLFRRQKAEEMAGVVAGVGHVLPTSTGGAGCEDRLSRGLALHAAVSLGQDVVLWLAIDSARHRNIGKRKRFNCLAFGENHYTGRRPASATCRPANHAPDVHRLQADFLPQDVGPTEHNRRSPGKSSRLIAFVVDHCR